MWPKDDYQEHMLGYLGALQIEIERLTYNAELQQRDLNTFYADLDATSTWLWRLIEMNDDEWEICRYALEASCDRLLRRFDYVPFAASLMKSGSLPPRESPERNAELSKSAVMMW